MDEERRQRMRKVIIDEVVALSLIHKHLVIELPTSTGKGLAVIECIKASKSSKPWIVLVPETAQINNYKQDVIKHGNEWMLTDGVIEDVMCYASAKKLIGKQVNLHINEAHRLSENRMEYLSLVEFDQILSDGATIDSVIEERLNIICPFYKYKKEITEMVEMGIIPPFKVKCINVPLRTEGKTEIYSGVKYTPENCYKRMTGGVEYWKTKWETDGREWQRIKWLSSGNNRKKWMGKYKNEACSSLINSFRGRRMICYMSSVEQAIQMGGENAVYAGNNQNKEIIRKFNEGIIDEIYSCMMLVEGMNFTNVNVGIIQQLDSKDRSFVQKLGRILRGSEPIVYILYIKNTKDEAYLKESLQTINPSYVEFY